MKLKEYLDLREPGAEVTCWDRDIDSEFYFYTKESGEKTLYGKDFPNVEKCDELLKEYLDVVAIRKDGIMVNLYEFLDNPAIISFAKEHMFEEHQYEDDSDVVMMLFDDNVKNFSNGYEGFSELMVQCLTEAFGDQTRWICVYKDTLAPHADVDNLVNIELPADWLYKVLRAEGEEDIEAWFGEYTADSTEAIARKAIEDGVILGCDDEYVMNSILFRKENPELINAAEKVEEFLDSFNGHEDIPDELGFEFKGMLIKDPFYDETMRFEVDPFIYYGADNMKSFLEKAKLFISKNSDKKLDDVIISCEKMSKKTVEQFDKNVKKPEIEF